MTEPTDAATREAYESAIRSFTEAEVALREIVAAVQRYRSAADLMADAGEVLAASHEAQTATLATLATMAAEMARLATSLGEAAGVIAALDPERFWASFTELEARVNEAAERGIESDAASIVVLQASLADSSAETWRRIGDASAEQVAATSSSTGLIVERLDTAISELGAASTASADQLRARLDDAVAQLAAGQKASTSELSSSVAETSRLATHARALGFTAVAIGSFAIGMLLALLLR